MTRQCIEHTLKVTLYLDSVTVSLFVQVKWNQRNLILSLKIPPSLSTGRVGELGRMVIWWSDRDHNQRAQTGQGFKLKQKDQN